MADHDDEAPEIPLPTGSDVMSRMRRRKMLRERGEVLGTALCGSLLKDLGPEPIEPKRPDQVCDTHILRMREETAALRKLGVSEKDCSIYLKAAQATYGRALRSIRESLVVEH